MVDLWELFILATVTYIYTAANAHVYIATVTHIYTIAVTHIYTAAGNSNLAFSKPKLRSFCDPDSELYSYTNAEAPAYCYTYIISIAYT